MWIFCNKNFFMITYQFKTPFLEGRKKICRKDNWNIMFIGPCVYRLCCYIGLSMYCRYWGTRQNNQLNTALVFLQWSVYAYWIIQLSPIPYASTNRLPTRFLALINHQSVLLCCIFHCCHCQVGGGEPGRKRISSTRKQWDWLRKQLVAIILNILTRQAGFTVERSEFSYIIDIPPR